MKVLIVEDERSLADALEHIIKHAGYSADAVYTGDDALAYALGASYDVIVLDVMLPGMDGFEIVRRLRAGHNAVPVLILTARDELHDKVTGLDCGADDYMTKPFAPEELLARVRALGRRQGEVQLETLTFADVTLHLSTNDLICGARSVHLCYKEFEVLRLLMSSPGVIIPKDTLISRVWGDESSAEDNNVEAYISFLRKKLSFLGAHAVITVRRKVGYLLEAVP